MGYMKTGPTGLPITTKKQRSIVIPKKAKEYIKDCCGKVGLSLIIHTMRAGGWVILDGVPASGKTTIQKILYRLGYPYVMTSTDPECRIIHTLGCIDAEHQIPVDDIRAELGID